MFAASEDAAIVIADKLRSALWGIHKLAVLLPSGLEPIKVLHVCAWIPRLTCVLHVVGPCTAMMQR